MIKRCTCKNSWMDKRYGVSRRVMNKTQIKAGAVVVYRCTVCKKEVK